MKKIEYQAPEMEVVEMKYNTTLLAGSDGGGSSSGGTEDPEEL